MRVVHFAPGGGARAEPLCGSWGSLDTDWTDAAGGVTCPGCQVGLRAAEVRIGPPDEGAPRDDAHA
jgi:hypothetical protein